MEQQHFTTSESGGGSERAQQIIALGRAIGHPIVALSRHGDEHVEGINFGVNHDVVVIRDEHCAEGYPIDDWTYIVGHDAVVAFHVARNERADMVPDDDDGEYRTV